MKISPTLRSQISKFAAKTVGKLRGKTTGFTLIELLVVIAIIAVLAGMLFPAMSGVRNAARKTSAKNDVVQIVTAVKNYYVEYGKYPVASGSGTKSYTTANNELIDVLRYNSTGSGVATLNPRQIRFLEVPNAKIQTPAEAKSGLDSGGNWRDPWARPYNVFIDLSYSGRVGSITYTVSKTASKTEDVETEVAAVSSGNPDSSAGDPVASWK